MQTTSRHAPESVTSLDGLAHALRHLRHEAGDPSYAALAAQIGNLRASRGRSGRPGKVTVYDCFRPGRKRLDAQLFVDLIEVLGVPQSSREPWLDAYRAATGGRVPESRALAGVPAALMAPSTRLVGRERELGLLENRPPGSLTVVVGLAGAGKTELALHAAHLWRAKLPSQAVALNIDLRGYDPTLSPVSAASVVAQMLLALGVSARRVDNLDVEGRSQMLRRVVGKRPMIVLLDDAADADQVRPLLPVGERWRIVVTSRRRLPDLETVGGPPLVLGELSEEASLELLADEVGSERIDAEPEAAAQLAQACGRLALDLRLVGAVIATESRSWSIADHVARFAELPADQLVRPALGLSYEALPDPVRATLRLAALHPGPVFTTNQLHGMTAALRSEVEEHLGILTHEHLVIRGEQGYSLHDLVRAFARRRVILEDPRSAQLAAMRRLCDVLVAETRAHATRGRPDSDWLERQLPLVLAFSNIAEDWDLGSQFAELVLLNGEFLDLSGRLTQSEHLLRRAIPHADAQLSGELRRRLGRVLELRGDLPGALEVLSSALAPGQPDRWRHLNGVGNVLKRMGRLRSAARHYRMAAQEAEDPFGRGRALGNLGDALRMLGHDSMAEHLLAQAHICSTEADDDVNLLIILSNRSRLAEQQGKWDLAEDLARQSAAAGAPFGFVVLEVMAHDVIARCRAARGDAQGALAELSRAIEQGRELGLLESVCALQATRSTMLVAQGDLRGASVGLAAAKAEAERLGLLVPEVTVHNGLGHLARAHGDLDAAIAEHRTAAELAAACGDQVGLNEAEASLAVAVSERMGR